MAKQKPAENQAMVQSGDQMALAELNELQNEFSGSIQVRKELIKIPTLKLAHALSRAFEGGLAKPGEFYCETKGETYGPVVTIIPLLVYENASKIDKTSSEILCSSDDLISNRQGQKCATQCPFNDYWNDWGSKENRKTPGCKAALNVVCIVPGTDAGFENVMIMSFRKTNHPAGRNLVNLIAADKRRIPFGSKYVLNSTTQTNQAKQTYQVINPSKIERVETSIEDIRAIIPIARKILDWKKAGKIETVVHDEEPAPDDSDVPY